MNQVKSAALVEQGTLPQPVQQFIPIRCCENVTESVAVFGARNALGHGKQMQVMIAEHADGGVAQVADGAEGLQRAGTAIDEVADEPDLVGSRIETDSVQQCHKLGMATLNITYGIGGHVTQ